ncbi:MAG: hypothetical protein M1817_004610 [Caeruleum heppii]|nr:MAG: hypothetical protein M1817_004610 [Caeruleum heppii]
MPLMRRWSIYLSLAVLCVLSIYLLGDINVPHVYRTKVSGGTTQIVDNEPEGTKPLPDEGFTKTSPGSDSQTTPVSPPTYSSPPYETPDPGLHWSKQPEQYPVPSYITLPSGQPERIPRIQHAFTSEDREAGIIREERLQAVKESFKHAWKGYKENAWLKDEVGPISGDYHNTFGGWAATLVDTLDTLWIMDLKDDFGEAVEAIAKIDFTTTDEDTINVFETTIRYLGGLLGAYDLSGGDYPILLKKAKEIGEILYCAFDTPNRMPVTRWNWRAYTEGDAPQVAPGAVLIAELGSLTVEFTRLSQLTEDPKYYDAVQRISDVLEEAQSHTKLPGLWPVSVDAASPSFREDGSFTLGGMADSLYEYFPKQYLILGGLKQQYRKMYEDSMAVIKKLIFFRPMTKDNRDILLSGDAHVSDDGRITTDSRAQHLGCFTGGMVAIGAKIFNRPKELTIAEQLVDGCLWGYDSMVSGIMPEIFFAVPCESNANSSCKWDERKWYDAVSKRHGNLEDTLAATREDRAKHVIKTSRLPEGFVAITDRRYILRPETIESVFILYRVTGNTTYQDRGWAMFRAIEKHTRTDIAHAALDDVSMPEPPKADRMESFWLAETLKYFYLLFAEPRVVSLDEYILNTEAHPLKRPQPD